MLTVGQKALPSSQTSAKSRAAWICSKRVQARQGLLGQHETPGMDSGSFESGSQDLGVHVS